MSTDTKPLYAAINQGDNDHAANLLAEMEGDMSQAQKDGLLQYCLRQRSPDVALMAIAVGADPNMADTEKHTPALVAAVEAGDVEGAVLLLVSGARPDMADALGNTAAHYAAALDMPAVLEILHRYGADLSVRNHTGHSPADSAAVNERHQSLDYLLSQGAAPVAAAPRRRVSM